MYTTTGARLRRLLSLILSLAMALSLAVSGAWAEDQEISLENGDFETGDTTGWTLTGFQEVKSDSWASNNTTYALNLWCSDSEDTAASASYTLSLEAGSYRFTFDLSGAEGDSGLGYTVSSGGSTLAASDGSCSTTGWDQWATVTTETFTLTETAQVTFALSGTVPAGYWGYLDNLALYQTASGVTEEGYQIDLSGIQTSAAPGDTISLTAGITYNGEEITDLSAAGLNFTFWADSWNDHSDGNSDATISDEHSITGAAATLPSEGIYYIVGELYDSDWTQLASSCVTVTVSAPQGYQVTVSASPEGTLSAGDTVSLTASVSYNGTAITDLEAAGLQLWWWTDVWEEGHTDGLSDASYDNYDDNSGYSLTADVTLPSVGSYYIAAELQDSSGRQAITYTALTTEQSSYITGDLDVEKISGLSEDYIMGLDISSVVSEFASGVTFQDFEGNTLSNVTEFCQFLRSCGITHIRVRVWNDPYDADGNGYGGGNNDLETAVEIAQACASAGLKLLVDFHCSDFWADPGKQQAPKAWSGYTLEEKEDAVYDFISDSLDAIAATGAQVDMVQVGNETTGGFVGETSVANMCTLFSAGAKAVRDFSADTKVVIHVTNPEKSNMTTWASRLSENGVDYDVLATSYYPYWHGSLENLKSQMETVRETYGKDVMVAETSYAYTLDDSDGHDNTVREGNNTSVDTATAYPFTPQGQASFLRDLMAAVSEAGGLGVYYWEPAWITVGDTTGLTGDAYDAQVEANQALWEAYGSGWASSYAAEYDPDDAGTWYGGSAVDNQALFYPDGTPLASLHVWEYVKTGSVSNQVSVESVESFTVSVEQGDSFTLPETATVTYSKGAVAEPVTWDADDLAAADSSQVGTYVIHGTVSLSLEVTDGDYAGATTAETTYTLTVLEPNLITDPSDAGLEAGDNFTIDGSGVKSIPSTEDVLAGSGCLHWYSASATESTVTYNLPLTLEAGWYTFEAAAMGYAGDTVTLRILDADGQTLFTGDPATLAGWTTELSQCLTPAVTFHLEASAAVSLQIVLGISDGGWGSVDCLYLHQHAALSYTDNQDGTHAAACSDCGLALGTEDCALVLTGATGVQSDADAALLYRCACGAEETVSLTAQIQGLPDQISLLTGDSTDLVASYTAGELPEEVTLTAAYAVSDSAVAQVTQEGSLTALGAGSCELTYSVLAQATLSDGSQTSVTVAQKVIPVTVEEQTPSVPTYTITTRTILDGDVSSSGPEAALTGAGSYAAGETVTLVAGDCTGYQFQGWYSSEGELLTTERSYTVTVESDLTLCAGYTADKDDSGDSGHGQTVLQRICQQLRKVWNWIRNLF